MASCVVLRIGQRSVSYFGHASIVLTIICIGSVDSKFARRSWAEVWLGVAKLIFSAGLRIWAKIRMLLRKCRTGFGVVLYGPVCCVERETAVKGRKMCL
jgi:hypothetical protein